MAMSKSAMVLLLLVLLTARVMAARAQERDHGEQLDDPELLDPDETWHKKHCVARPDFNSDYHVFDHFQFRLQACLLTWSDTKAFDHVALCKQPQQKGDGPPCGYVLVPVKGLDGDECTLALRADNLFLAAFANGKKKWFVFPRYKHMFPSATVLDFGNDYKDLMEENYLSAKLYPLGKYPSLQAASVISRYEKGPGSSEQYITAALSTMVLTIPEAKRFTPIRETILQGWEDGTTLNDAEVELLVSWRELSCAVLVAKKNGVWGNCADAVTLKDKGIAQTLDDALGKVDVILQPKNRAKSKCPYL